MTHTPSLFQISYEVPGDISSSIFDFWMNLVFEHQTSSSVARVGDTDTGPWAFLWFLETNTPPVLNNLQDHVKEEYTQNPSTFAIDFNDIDFIITPVAHKNWLAECYQTFPPFTVGSFFVRGSHDRAVPVPKDKIGLIIDAVTAFGSGEHSTTRGCLTSLLTLNENGLTPARILDLGTGSGILAIAARKLWRDAIILAVDNDPESIKIATEYAALNESQMIVELGDTPTAPHVAIHGPFDLIIANILAGPLCELAPAITSSLTQKGTLILSGLLDSQINDVAASYRPFGWIIRDQIVATDNWAVLTLAKQ